MILFDKFNKINTVHPSSSFQINWDSILPYQAAPPPRRDSDSRMRGYVKKIFKKKKGKKKKNYPAAADFGSASIDCRYISLLCGEGTWVCGIWTSGICVSGIFC